MKRHDSTKIILSDEAFSAAMENPSIALYDLYGDEIIVRAFSLLPDIKASSFLCMAAKKEKAETLIRSLLQKEGADRLYEGLKSTSPKIRKNTTRLIGAVCAVECDEALIEAISHEDVRMVRPSMLLALGALHTDRAYEFLHKYTVKPANDETEKKHYNEECEALRKALSTFSTDSKHIFRDFASINELQLICASPLGKYAADDCRRAGLSVKSYSPSSVTISGDKAERIYAVRSFRELCIPLGSVKDKDLRSIAVKTLDLLHEKGDFPYRYRIEYRGDGDRREAIKAAVALFECDKFLNSPSDYECEFRIYSNGRVSLFPHTYHDNRYTYRKAALPASIAPANAAAVMSYAREYLKEDSTVLDFCCGSGTMLFERDLCLTCKALIGCDISDNAINTARENAKYFGSKVRLYRTDLRKIRLNMQVDEIISNLPFGNRVGTHAENEKLYEDIFKKAAELLKAGGIMILYTMESSLLHKNIRKSGDFELISEIKTEAGGLFPAAAILKRT